MTLRDVLLQLGFLMAASGGIVAVGAMLGIGGRDRTPPDHDDADDLSEA